MYMIFLFFNLESLQKHWGTGKSDIDPVFVSSVRDGEYY